MTDLRTAAQQALEALESLFTLQADDARPKRCGDAITALRAALEQPEQEPVAMLWKVRKALALASAICDRVPNRWHHTHEIGSAEADIGDMVNAHPDGTHGYRLIQEAEAELVAYLTTPEAAPQRQPEQEPVASIYVTIGGDREFDDWRYPLPVGRNLLYTHPPRREWQSLSDTEIGMEYVKWDATPGASMAYFARAIEAALREKNND